MPCLPSEKYTVKADAVTSLPSLRKVRRLEKLQVPPSNPGLALLGRPQETQAWFLIPHGLLLVWADDTWAPYYQDRTCAVSFHCALIEEPTEVGKTPGTRLSQGHGDQAVRQMRAAEAGGGTALWQETEITIFTVSPLVFVSLFDCSSKGPALRVKPPVMNGDLLSFHSFIQQMNLRL